MVRSAHRLRLVLWVRALPHIARRAHHADMGLRGEARVHLTVDGAATRCVSKVIVCWRWANLVRILVVAALVDRTGRHLIVSVVLVHAQAISKSLLIDYEVDAACAVWGQLAEDDVLRDASQGVMLSEEGSLEQNLCGLFEGAFSERATIDSVDSMASDGGEDTSLSHHVDQSTQMAVVDVDTVCSQNHAQLFDEGLTGSLDAKNLEDFDRMVAGRARCVDALDLEDTGHVDAVSLDQPAIFDPVHGTCFRVVLNARANIRTRRVEDLRDFLEPSKLDLMEDIVSDFSDGVDDFLSFLVADIVQTDSDNLPVDRDVIRVHHLDHVCRFLAVTCVLVATLLDALDHVSLESEVV